MLSEAQRKSLRQMPDSGWLYAYKLGRRQTIDALVRRGLAVREHTDGWGERHFDGYRRTPAGHAALKGE